MNTDFEQELTEKTERKNVSLLPSAFAARQLVASQRNEDGSAASARRRRFSPVQSFVFPARELTDETEKSN